MSERNRDGRSKARLIIVASVAAALLILGLVAVGLINEARYQRYAADQSTHYSKYADQKVGEACRGIPAEQLVRCFSEARIESELEKRSYQHNQADLVAQRKSALWTSLMGIAALLGMGLSIVGVVLVWTTFRETRKANKIALDAQRPWVSIDVEVTEFRVAKEIVRFCYLVRFTNIGKTVASNVWTASDSDFMGRDHSEKALANLERWRSMNASGEFVPLMPGESVEHEASKDFQLSEIPWFSVETNLKARLIVNAVAYYFVSEGRKADDARLTERTFFVGGKNVNPLKQLVIHKARIGGLNAETVVTRRTGPSSTT